MLGEVAENKNKKLMTQNVKLRGFMGCVKIGIHSFTSWL